MKTNFLIAQIINVHATRLDLGADPQTIASDLRKFADNLENAQRLADEAQNKLNLETYEDKSGEDEAVRAYHDANPSPPCVVGL